MAAGAIELVVTDLDGTLWDGVGGTHARTLEALRTLARDGVPVLAATARRPSAALDVMRAHETVLPAVLFDGALGRDFAGDATFHREALSRDACLGLIEVFEQHGVEPCLNIDDADKDFLVGERPSTHPAHLAYNEPRTRHVDLRLAAKQYDVLSLIVCGLSGSVLHPLLEDLIGHASAVVTADRTYGGYSLSVRRSGVNKWSGVQSFCRARGLDESRVLAVGDGDNDIELLTNAAIACVPEDGCEAALALADHRIPRAVEGGWASILDHLR